MAEENGNTAFFVFHFSAIKNRNFFFPTRISIIHFSALTNSIFLFSKKKKILFTNVLLSLPFALTLSFNVNLRLRIYPYAFTQHISTCLHYIAMVDLCPASDGPHSKSVADAKQPIWSANNRPRFRL